MTVPAHRRPAGVGLRPPGGDLVDTLIAALSPGQRERFELPEGALGRVALAVELHAAGPGALVEVEGALRLVAALDGDLASPTAASRLRAVLRADPGVQAVLEARAPRADGAIDHQRRFLAQEGRAAQVSAPREGRPAPSPTDGRALRVADFLEPGRPVLPRRTR